jgi:hypothetical protein
VVGPSPRLGEVEAPPRSRSSLSSKAEVESEPLGRARRRPSAEARAESEPLVGRSGVRRLPGLSPSPSPGVGRSGVRRLPGLSPSPSPRVGRSGVPRLPGLSPSLSPGVGRSRVHRLPGLSPSPSPSSDAEFPMAPEAGLGCCQPHSVERHSSRSGAGDAVLLSGRSVERRSDYGHFGSVD